MPTAKSLTSNSTKRTTMNNLTNSKKQFKYNMNNKADTVDVEDLVNKQIEFEND